MQGDFREVAFNYICGDATGTYFVSNKRKIDELLKWADELPDLVTIDSKDYEDGEVVSVVATLPKDCFKVKKPKRKVKKILTDDEKEVLNQRLQEGREKAKREKLLKIQ